METSHGIKEYKPTFPLSPSQMENRTPGEEDIMLEKPRRGNPHRRYTAKWFGHVWDRAVEVGRWPRLLYLAIGSLLIGGWIGAMYVLLSFLYTALTVSFL
jgi:hypothetical protein